MAKKNVEMDSQWFFDRLDEKRMSLRGLAKLMNMSPSSLSLRFNGAYKITTKEATLMATLLGVTFEEIVNHTGIKIPKAPGGQIELVGRVVGSTIKMAKGGGSIGRPDALSGDCVAIRGVEPGWIYFYNPSQKLQPEAVGRLAVVENKWLGVLERGSERGTWNVRGVFDDAKGGVEGVKVGVACPVLLILP